jgi:hypothetical protein
MQTFKSSPWLSIGHIHIGTLHFKTYRQHSEESSSLTLGETTQESLAHSQLVQS